MNIPKKKGLSARLKDDVYKKLNLVDSVYSEFHFNEMVDIFHLPGMEDRPTLLQSNSTKFLFSLVCFSPPNQKGLLKERPSKNHLSAHKLSLALLYHCFSEPKDRSSIRVAMDNFPSIAIFMALIPKEQKTKHCKSKPSSIFEHKSTSCLSVLNFLRDQNQQTQVLGLATTLLAPPPESIHVMWHKIGLATYLLCILVNQHTGIGDGSLENSKISLQASMERDNPARQFYLKLGLTDHDLFDNGFSLTSAYFQVTVDKFPQLWITSDSHKMSLFQLTRGCLKIPDVILDLTMDDSLSPKKCSWKNYGYSRFPYEAKSMKAIESFAEICPILKSFSFGRLPLTDPH